MGTIFRLPAKQILPCIFDMLPVLSPYLSRMNRVAVSPSVQMTFGWIRLICLSRPARTETISLALNSVWCESSPRRIALVSLERKSLKAVHDADLESVLADLGLLAELKEGRLRCAICGCSVSEENLRCIFPQGAEIKVCCDKPDCFVKAVGKGESK